MVVLTFHDFSMALEYVSYVDIVYHDTIIVYPNKVFNSVLLEFSFTVGKNLLQIKLCI